jgi:alkyl hydroperoxide reductase subunit AhpC
MNQLREFAQHKADFDRINTRIVALSVDDVEHAHETWDKAANRQLPILSDPGAKVVREYGLLHADGHSGQDIAIRTTIYLDGNGVEQWRRVSTTAMDVPRVKEVMDRIQAGH